MKKWYAHLEDKIGFVCFIIMLLITFINVISRKVFHASLSFTEEFTTTALVLLSLLGIAGSAYDGSNFNMSYVADMMPPRVFEILHGLNNLIMGATCLILTVTSCSMVIYQYQMHTVSIAMQIPEWIYGLFMPIGCAFMTYRFFQRAIRYFLRKIHKEGDEEE